MTMNIISDNNQNDIICVGSQSIRISKSTTTRTHSKADKNTNEHDDIDIDSTDEERRGILFLFEPKNNRENDDTMSTLYDSNSCINNNNNIDNDDRKGECEENNSNPKDQNNNVNQLFLDVAIAVVTVAQKCTCTVNQPTIVFYHTRMSMDDIKIHSPTSLTSWCTYNNEDIIDNMDNKYKCKSNQDKLDWVTKTMLQQIQDPNIQVSFTRVTSSTDVNVNTIQLTIKQSIRNIVRIVYSRELVEQSQVPSLQNILYAISTSINQSQNKIKSLQSDIDSLHKQIYAWKDTASKLSIEYWQKEKDELMQNYLVLLNRIKHDYVTKDEELKKEKEYSKSLEIQLQSYKRGGIGNVDGGDNIVKKQYRSKQPSVQINNHTKNHQIFNHEHYEQDVFDEHEVELLAQGKKVDFAKLNDGIKPIATTTEPVTTPSIRSNPHTGVIEIWSTDDIFNDDEEKMSKVGNNNKQESLSSAMYHCDAENSCSNNISVKRRKV